MVNAGSCRMHCSRDAWLDRPELSNLGSVQYRGSCLTSPSPVIRDSEGPFDMELFKLFPPRDAHVSAQMQKLKDYFLHTVIFHLDKEGRPVGICSPSPPLLLVFPNTEILRNSCG